MKLAIKTENLSKHYSGKTVVNSINLNVVKSQVYGFLGRNGAGKTTTIKMLLSLVKKDRGKIAINGLDINKHKKDILSKIGSIIEFPGFYGNLTARENLKIYYTLGGIQDKHAIDSVMEMVSLKNEGNEKVSGFSLGMKQRLGIARALLNNPEILILDEPTNGLDPAGIKEIRIILKNLAEIHGKTLFVSSHILSEVEQIAHRIGIIHKGKLLEEINIDELHERTKKCIICSVNNPSKAVFLLEKELNIKNFEVLPGNELHIYNSLEKIHLINRLFVKNDIDVYTIKLSKDKLEDYFLQLTRD